MKTASIETAAKAERPTDRIGLQVGLLFGFTVVLEILI